MRDFRSSCFFFTRRRLRPCPYWMDALLDETFVCTISAIVTGETVNEIYSRVKDVIRSHSGPVIWIPARHPLWLSSSTIFHLYGVCLKTKCILTEYLAEGVQLFTSDDGISTRDQSTDHSQCGDRERIIIFKEQTTQLPRQCRYYLVTFLDDLLNIVNEFYVYCVCMCVVISFGRSSRHIALGACVSFYTWLSLLFVW